MFPFTAAILFSIVSTGIASTQTPNITSCSATHVVVIDDVTITDAAVGKTMIISYVGQLTQALNDSPSLRFTMTRNAGGGQVPCINDLGSCQFDLCGGTSDREREIGAPWNNTCPIPAGSYDTSVSLKIPYLAVFFIGNGDLHVKMEIINGGTPVECVEMNVQVKI
ncbi:immunoglobulin-binding protein, putative [Ixodes scapularis]|uniref:Immunoglobulin-binding protein, putative n=1 Tax=Ixodes scapularis TaxID=6945 RepID=B7Q5V3_IXOSC|nr:immunoglobulin-binding protein, putative [Ixodes scapularis]|eukprot:XP_002411824.1 immunoglobulin-binding protein, putative [Ixodes scapularis]